MKLDAVVFIIFNVLIGREIVKPARYSHCQTEPSNARVAIVTENGPNDSTLTENDSSKYTVEEDAAQLKYKFHSGARCVELKYDGVSVWNHEANRDGTNYPVEVSLNPHANSLKIKTASRLFIYAYRNSQWVLTLESEVVPCGNSATKPPASVPKSAKPAATSAPTAAPVESASAPKPDSDPNPSTQISASVPSAEPPAADADKSADSPPVSKAAPDATTHRDSPDPFVRRLFELGVEITTVDDRFNLRVNDLSHFRVMQENETILYQLTDFKAYCEVKYKGEVVWKDKYSRRGVSYPSFIFINLDGQVIRLNLVGGDLLWSDLRNQIRRYFNLYLVNLGYKSPDAPLTLQTLVFNLKIRNTDGSRFLTNTVHVEPLAHNSLGLLKRPLNPNEQCLEITFKSKPVWKHSPKIDKQNYPTQIDVDFGPIVLVKLKFTSRLNIYSYLNDRWVFSAQYLDDFASSDQTA